MIKTRVWSAIAPGFVRKKKARVTWKSEREVMIVAAEMTAILKCGHGWRKAGLLSFFKSDLEVSQIRSCWFACAVQKCETGSCTLKIGLIVDPVRDDQGSRPLSFSTPLSLRVGLLTATVDEREEHNQKL